MGKATPFEGELDAFGFPCCGQSFMGGTLCTDEPGHSGGCSTMCQNCGDASGNVCTCYVECPRCEDYFVPEGTETNCPVCMDELRTVPNTLDMRHDEFASHADDWCDTMFAIWNDVFQCRRYVGHAGPHSCGGAVGKKNTFQGRPLTDEELAEVHRSLLGIQ